MVRPYKEKKVVNNPSMQDQGGRREDDQVPPQTSVLPEEIVSRKKRFNLETTDVWYKIDYSHKITTDDSGDDSICRMNDRVK